MDKILITGISGQDGSTLAQKLLDTGDKVFGIVRRSSTPNLKNLPSHKNLDLRYGDITDSGAIRDIVDEIRPDIIFHFAAQSHVGVSFENPHYTLETTAVGTLNILEAIRRIDRTIRFYNAASSEMFGGNIDADGFQRETTPFAPNSPYAVGKLAAFHLTRQYREAYDIHASSGILFNHEGARRGYDFVTRKISRYVAMLAVTQGKNLPPLVVGNVNACRDWGWCDDYMLAAYLMTQQESPDDYVVATGETNSVLDLLHAAFAVIGELPDPHVQIDSTLFRDNEVPLLKGDASKARAKMNWAPSVDFKGLVKLMVEHDIQEAKRLLGKI
jgi:GDPmannose 4,6-dehydratase